MVSALYGPAMGGDVDPQLLHRVERARRVVSLCSQAIIRSYDEAAILAEACRMLLDVGDYRMAWIGEVGPGGTGMKALASASALPSGVRGEPPWGDDVGIQSPAGRAVREQRPQVVRGIPRDPALRQQHPDADTLGYASVCAFPMQFGPNGAGALAIYAREPDAFASEEVALLREMAGDLGMGVALLRARQSSRALEAQLAAAEQRFRSLIENAPVGVLQITLEGQVRIANLALANLLGYATAADLVAQTPAQLSAHLDDADLQRVGHTIRSGPPYKPLELRLRRRDGAGVWVYVQAQPGIGVGERVVEAFVRDLTHVRAAQLATARLAAVVDSSEEAIIGIDAAGVVENWSRGAAALYGYAAKETLGRPFAEVCVPEERRPEWERIRATLAKGRRVKRFETQRLCKRGIRKEVSVAASPIFDSGRRPVGASLIEHDIGDRKRAEAAHLVEERQQEEVFRLQELARMRSEFMGKASHELNTPLTPVLLQVQSLKESGGLDARQALALASIERNVIRLAVLVKDLLSASSLNTGRLELNPCEVDLRDLAAEAVESFQGQARQAGVFLQMNAARPAPAFADGDRVMQVLFNLLSNALKFTPAQGSIDVQAEELHGESMVTVHDTGFGFSEGLRARLFTAFGRLHEDKPNAPGSGLGLFISKGIIEGSGGEIWAESPGPGQGCTIGFKLPKRPGKGIRAAQGFGQAAPESAAPGPPGVAKPLDMALHPKSG